jgi:hypothetical protein
MLRLQTDSLDWALQHALNYGDTDLLPLAFEFHAIAHDWIRVRGELAKADLDLLQVRPHRQLLAPKGRYAFRVTSQLDPLDFLLYTAAVYEIGPQIENGRIPRARDTVFSFRFDPEADGRIFSPDVGYPEFTARTRTLVADPQVAYVAVADIADFYPRVYHHPLENALDATGARDHSRCIMKLLDGWSASVSHGLPVGNAASRLLAELDIANIDEGLLAEGINFIRFNDDYRIFAASASEAYRHLASLAAQLYEVHGLTLQPNKTRILSVDQFQDWYLREPQEREVDALRERFHELLSEIGVEDEYAALNYDDLDDDQQALIDELNLKAIFEAEAAEDEPDLTTLRFSLRRMGQMGSADLVDPLMRNIESIHPVLPDIVNYLSQLRHLTPADRADIGRRWLDLLEDSVLAELEYHRIWALNVFATGTDWNNEARLVPMLGTLTDVGSRRQILLALGRAHAAHWFFAHRRNLFNESPWARRAFLAGASCLPPDQRKHWYASIESRLDLLEEAVVKWARANPF